MKLRVTQSFVQILRRTFFLCRAASSPTLSHFSCAGLPVRLRCPLGSVAERFPFSAEPMGPTPDTKNAFDELVCAAEESGDNGLVVLDEDVKEQISDAIKDGLGADYDAVIMQRQVPAVLGCLRSVHQQWLWRCWRL